MQSSCATLSSRIFTVSSSGTSSPWSMYFFASMPSSVPFLMFARKISPVEIWGIANFSAIIFACVPFPAPGAPNIIIFMLISSFNLTEIIKLWCSSFYNSFNSIYPSSERQFYAGISSIQAIGQGMWDALPPRAYHNWQKQSARFASIWLFTCWSSARWMSDQSFKKPL